ncbi:MAG: minor capsid protein [Sphingobacteriales bacterium]|nr:minor capsid protein [Sphingobacteriales bacterium]
MNADKKRIAELDALMETVAKDLYDAKIKEGQIPIDIYHYNAKKLTDAMWHGLDGTSFSFEDSRNELSAYLQQNIHAFSAAKSLYEMQLFTKMMTKQDGSLRSFTDFRNSVMDAGHEINHSWLQTEYNTAKSSAEMARKWDEFSSNGVEYLEYSTVGDGHVRPEHARLDKFTAKTTDKIWNTIYPPNGWNCRCSVVPGIAGNASKITVDPKADFQKEYKISPYFQKNMGRNKQLFDLEKNTYLNNLKGITTGDNSYPDSLSALDAIKNYNLPAVEKILADSVWPAPHSFENAADAIEWFDEVYKKEALIKTPTGITVKLRRESFRHAIEDKPDDKRWEFGASFNDILNNPDEVWQRLNNKGKKLETEFIKYFDAAAIVVRVDKDLLGWTIHKITTDKQARTLRSGQLIYIKR